MSFGGTGDFAVDLVTMMDQPWQDAHHKDSTLERYSVACRLDLVPRTAWRTATLGFQQDDSTALPYRQQLLAGSAYTPAGKLGLAYAAIAASSMGALAKSKPPVHLLAELRQRLL